MGTWNILDQNHFSDGGQCIYGCNAGGVSPVLENCSPTEKCIEVKPGSVPNGY